MHARIDHLLSLRDGQPVDAAIAAHVEQCGNCSSRLRTLRLTQLHLQTLPQTDSNISFEQIRQALQRPPAGVRRFVPARIAAAIAIVSLVAIVFIAVRDDPPQQLAVPSDAAERGEPSASSAQVMELVAQSQRLENLLEQLPERPHVERVSTAATIDTIEQRIQWLDFHLSDAPDSALSEQQARRLWSERVELMDSLVKVRYAESGGGFQ